MDAHILKAVERLIRECEQHPCAAPNADLVANARSEFDAHIAMSRLLLRLNMNKRRRSA